MRVSILGSQGISKHLVGVCELLLRSLPFFVFLLFVFVVLLRTFVKKGYKLRIHGQVLDGQFRDIKSKKFSSTVGNSEYPVL